MLKILLMILVCGAGLWLCYQVMRQQESDGCPKCRGRYLAWERETSTWRCREYEHTWRQR